VFLIVFGFGFDDCPDSQVVRENEYVFLAVGQEKKREKETREGVASWKISYV